MWATVSVESVHRPTRTPSRAAAYAASQPACPAPITMTSNRSRNSLPDAEAREDVREQIVVRAVSGDFFERGARVLQIGENKFFGQGAVVRDDRVSRARQRSEERRVGKECRS